MFKEFSKKNCMMTLKYVYLKIFLDFICIFQLLTCNVHIISANICYVYDIIHFNFLTFYIYHQNMPKHILFYSFDRYILLPIFLIELIIIHFIVPIYKFYPLGFISLRQNLVFYSKSLILLFSYLTLVMFLFYLKEFVLFLLFI